MDKEKPSKFPYVICKICGEHFESQIKIDPSVYRQVPNLRVGDNTFTCPFCDKRADYSERDFIYTESQAIELESFGKIVRAIAESVESSENPLKAATQLLATFEEAKSDNNHAVFQKSSNLKFLKKWIPDTPEKLAAYVVIGQLIFHHLSNHPDEPIDANNIFYELHQTIVIQPTIIEKKTSTPEPSRNADCPCGSGKKYKHCHGQLL